MTISMYSASVPLFSEMLEYLAHVLTKAEADAEARGIDPAVFLNGRLAPDMLPLKRQVQIATDNAKGAPSRLAGIDIPSWPDTEETFAELQARIALARDYVSTFSPEQIDGSEEKEIVLRFGGQEIPFTGQPYLIGYAIPNFLFHVSAAYMILRHLGVPLGKADYFGRG